MSKHAGQRPSSRHILHGFSPLQAWQSRAHLYQCAGMFSGAVQTAISTPVDLLKIRQQLQIARSGMASYVGPLQLLRQILKTDGIPGEREHPIAVLENSQSDPHSRSCQSRGKTAVGREVNLCV